MTDAAGGPPPQDWPDLGGRCVSGRHVLPVRVYFEDTDFSGVVYHAAYIRFMERGRSDLLRLAGIPHEDLRDGVYGEPLYFAIRDLAARFIAPASIDDRLEVVTRVAALGRARLVMEQQIRRGIQTMVRAQVEALVIGADRKPRRLPDRLREQLATLR